MDSISLRLALWTENVPVIIILFSSDEFNLDFTNPILCLAIWQPTFLIRFRIPFYSWTTVSEVPIFRPMPDVLFSSISNGIWHKMHLANAYYVIWNSVDVLRILDGVWINKRNQCGRHNFLFIDFVVNIVTTLQLNFPFRLCSTTSFTFIQLDDAAQLLRGSYL